MLHHLTFEATTPEMLAAVSRNCDPASFPGFWCGFSDSGNYRPSRDQGRAGGESRIRGSEAFASVLREYSWVRGRPI